VSDVRVGRSDRSLESGGELGGSLSGISGQLEAGASEGEAFVVVLEEDREKEGE
jgi:hypothetical protein